PRVFTGTQSSTLKVSNLRMSADVLKTGGSGQSTVDLRVWGLGLSVMNDLCAWGQKAGFVGRNTVSVSAGDVGKPPKIVIGNATIYNSLIDGQNQPDLSLRVGANSGIVEAATTLPDVTARGRADGAALLQSICDRIGWIFENASDVHVRSEERRVG